MNSTVFVGPLLCPRTLYKVELRLRAKQICTCLPDTNRALNTNLPGRQETFSHCMHLASAGKLLNHYCKTAHTAPRVQLLSQYGLLKGLTGAIIKQLLHSRMQAASAAQVPAFSAGQSFILSALYTTPCVRALVSYQW